TSPGQYHAKVFFLGYNEFESKFTIRPGQKEHVLSPLMEDSSIQLEGVDITNVQMVVMKGDTTEFNAAAFKTEPYADSDAPLTQLAGVEIDAEVNLMALGEKVIKIVVDGRTCFSTDPRVGMKNLPADIIDKVQIIDERSEESRFTGFDDGE